MAAITVKRNVFFSRIKPLLSLPRLYHKFVEDGRPKPQSLCEDDYMIFKPGEVDVSKWEKMDSRSLGITRKMVPVPPYTVLQILQSRGFEAYLVGGCVRDLLLNRTPKDFDVITTADLDQIRKQFHRCEIVGRRFPICRVHIKGSVVEVSSFDTMAKHAEGKEKFLVSQMPRGCDKMDLVRWKNSMHRDFTVNSLFFDPFSHKIFDYNDAMKDLLELKLRTLVPAQLSFMEDRARILRGLRIAARLGLSLSKEIKSAILKHASSISTLSQSRIMMELNYMLSFGAAESSLSLLHRYHLLEIFLPFQAAYISEQATRSGQSSMMLMKLLSHLDKLVTCDRPSGSRLWIGLLGFHLALVNNPQHPFVVLIFASVLYHQKWEDGLQFARRCGRAPVKFEPETSESYDFITDDEVAEKVNQLALLVLDSIDVLVETDSLWRAMAKFPDCPCAGLVFVPKSTGHSAAQLFHVLVHKVETYNKGRTSFEINYDLLGKGDSIETRFALGKIILNTMGYGIDQNGETIDANHHAPFNSENEHVMAKKEDRKHPLSPSVSKLQQGNAPKKQKLFAKLSIIMQGNEKQNAATEKTVEVIADEHQIEQKESEEGVSMKPMKVVGISSDPKKEDGSPMQKLICMLETVIDNNKSPSQLESQKLEERLKEDAEVEANQVISEEQMVERKRQGVLETLAGNDETQLGALLWSVQSNCNKAIEEARDSPAEMRKLNQFLVNFVEEQVLRKMANQLGSSSLVSSSIGSRQIKSEQLEASSLIAASVGTSQAENKQLEASSWAASFFGISEAESKQLELSSSVDSSIGTSEVKSTPQIRVEDPEEPKTKQRPKKVNKMESSIAVSMNSEGKKKQRVCSYCKEIGHNRTGCPKRKLEEASCKVDN